MAGSVVCWSLNYLDWKRLMDIWRLFFVGQPCLEEDDISSFLWSQGSWKILWYRSPDSTWELGCYSHVICSLFDAFFLYFLSFLLFQLDILYAVIFVMFPPYLNIFSFSTKRKKNSKPINHIALLLTTKLLHVHFRPDRFVSESASSIF